MRARVLLLRDAQGIWRLATVDPLLPLVAVLHRRAYTDAELARAHRHDVAEARKATADAARREAARRAATVDGAAAAPCAVALTADAPGDVVVQEGAGLARDQVAHAGVDLVGAGMAGRCLGVRSAGPLPARFTVSLHDASYERELEVEVADGRVVVLDTGDEDEPPRPLPGAAAHLEPDGLVVALPVALSGTVRVTLGVEASDVSYGDEARVRRG